jgi:large subunit ribosomal protein L29
MTSALENKSIAELHQMLVDRRVELFKMRMQKASQQAVRPHLVSENKREIARIKTKLTQLTNKNQGA